MAAHGDAGRRLAAGQVGLVHPAEPVTAGDLRPRPAGQAGHLHLVPGRHDGQPATVSSAWLHTLRSTVAHRGDRSAGSGGGSTVRARPTTSAMLGAGGSGRTRSREARSAWARSACPGPGVRPGRGGGPARPVSRFERCGDRDHGDRREHRCGDGHPSLQPRARAQGFAVAAGRQLGITPGVGVVEGTSEAQPPGAVRIDPCPTPTPCRWSGRCSRAPGSCRRPSRSSAGPSR